MTGSTKNRVLPYDAWIVSHIDSSSIPRNNTEDRQAYVENKEKATKERGKYCKVIRNVQSCEKYTMLRNAILNRNEMIRTQDLYRLSRMFLWS